MVNANHWVCGLRQRSNLFGYQSWAKHEAWVGSLRSESQEIFCGAKAAKGLQRRSHVRGRGLAADPGRHSGFSAF